ncbi:MAG: response regulator [candidate division Zixibacteria bacterium]
MKILVIDDEEMIRSMATKILERGGYEVIGAASGLDGLNLVRSDDDIGCVILDLTMPGMSGEETLKEIRSGHADLPCLLSSGQPVDVKAMGEELAINTDFLEKPYRASTLIEAVKRITEKA